MDLSIIIHPNTQNNTFVTINVLYNVSNKGKEKDELVTELLVLSSTK